MYADRGSKIDGSVLAAIRSAQGARIILVVDECGPDLRSELMRTFGGFGPALKLVTIYQDGEESDRASDYRLMDVPALPAGEIEAILHSYGVDAAYARGWAEMCEGSPRVAHVVGQNLRDNPDDPLRSDAFTRIWVRYLAADVPDTSEEYRKRHLVVATMALFKRFGWAPVVRAGTNEVYERIISQLDAGISKAQFAAIIEQMTNRKILQGDYFLYITPKALQIKLWTDWWKRYSASVDMNSLVPALSPQMRQWFGEMIEYADVAPVSKQVVARLLGPDGLYADADWLKTKDGARFFFSLSLADPLGALRLLERTLGKMSKEDLLGFDEGRRDAVRALEHMTLHGDLFRPAAKLLLALAEAENETWSNNATGTFSGLFSLGYGDLAPTSLAPEHRLPVLTEALARGGKRAEVALGAFNTALKLRSITRWGGDQPFRLKGPVQRWLPKTYGEWFDAYRLYWKTLEDALPTLSASMRRQGMGILLSRMRGLVGVELLRDEVLETLARLAAAREGDKQKVIESIGVILRYDRDGLPASVVEKLEAVRDYLVGITFSARLRRYAGMDILEDQLDNDENELSKAAQQLSDLAEHALRAPDEFQPELSWLVTDEGRSGYRFGHMLGQKDQECRLWGDILKAWRAAGARAHDFFIGGYLFACSF